MNRFLFSTLAALLSLLAPWPAQAIPADVGDLMEERVRSLVSVRFFIEMEVDRRPAGEIGVVADDNGLILLHEWVIPGWAPAAQLKEFKVSTLGEQQEFSAEYLGQDHLSGFHFLRVEEAARPLLTPVTAWGEARPAVGEWLWGMGIMDRDMDHEPYFLSSRLSVIRTLPQDLGFAVSEVATPGSLIFSADGAFVGWATLAYGLEHLLHMRDGRFPVVLQQTRQTAVFLPANEVLPFIGRTPQPPNAPVIPWAGITDLHPVELEVARFLGIEDKGSVVLGEIVPGAPAYQAGLREGDIVIAIAGEPIPRYRPHGAAVDHFQRAVLEKNPGSQIMLTYLRGQDRAEATVEIAVRPPTVREARRKYFTTIGVTLREFLLFDGMDLRVGPDPDRGAIVQFIRPNGPADTAGLVVGDWVTEIDGAKLTGYEHAMGLVTEAETVTSRREIVLMVNRGGETSVIRVRLR